MAEKRLFCRKITMSISTLAVHCHIHQSRTHTVKKMIIFIIHPFLIFHSTMHYYAYNFDFYHWNRHFTDLFHDLKILFCSNRLYCRQNMLIPQCKCLEHSIIDIGVQSITQQVFLTMFIRGWKYKSTCFGLIRPSSGLHPKGIRDL